MLTIAGTIAAGIATDAIFKIIDIWGQRAANKSLIKEAIRDVLVELENEFQGIIGYLRLLFYSSTSKNSTNINSFIDGVFRGDNQYEGHFIEVFRKDFTYRMEIYKDDPGYADFGAVKEYSPDIVSHRLIELTKKSIENKLLDAPLQFIHGQTTKRLKQIEKDTETLKRYQEAFDYITPPFFFDLSGKTTVSTDRYYFGNEPLWFDILADRDFKRALSGRIVRTVLRETNKPYVIPVLGNPKSGKSTLLRRIAYDLVMVHEKEVLWLKEDYKGTLKADQIITSYHENPRIIYIVCDNIIDKVYEWRDVINFIDRLSQSGIPCWIIASFQKGHWKQDRIQLQDLFLEDKRKAKPYEIAIDDREVRRFEEKIQVEGIKGVITKEEAFTRSKVEPEELLSGGRFLNYISYFTNDARFRNTVLNDMEDLERANHDIYRGVVWLATFFQFGIYVPKKTLRKIIGESCVSGMRTHKIAQKYVLEFSDRESFYACNHLVSRWVFDNYIEKTGNGELLKVGLEKLFDAERNDHDDLELILYLFAGFSFDDRYKHVIKDILDSKDSELRTKYASFSPEFLAFFLAPTFINIGLYDKSFEIFQNATDRNDALPDAYYNWGTALFEYAERSGNIGLFLESFKIFERAIQFNPNDIGAYNNWGNALAKYAVRERDEECLRDSFAKFDQATQLDPGFVLAYNNWGNALANYGVLKRRGDWLVKSVVKFKRATKLNPDYTEAYNNWGNALAYLAGLEGDNGRFLESFEKFRKATNLDASYFTAYMNWGAALFNYAKQNSDKVRFLEAFEKFGTAVLLNPNNPDIYHNWAVALAYYANLYADEERFHESFEKFNRSIQLKANNPLTYFRWGSGLNEYAKLKNDEEIYKEAVSKLIYSGLLFVLNGEFEEQPFLSALETKKCDRIELYTILLIMSSIRYIRNKKLEEENYSLMKEFKNFKGVYLILVNTILGENNILQTAEITDSVSIAAIKILINKIILMRRSGEL